MPVAVEVLKHTLRRMTEEEPHLLAPLSEWGIRRNAGVYTYLRDRLGAKTAREAEILIRKRLVDPSMVKFWIDEHMVSTNPRLRDVVAEGYPELAEDLSRAWSNYKARWDEEVVLDD
jgi:hypothetical protein